MKTFTLLLRCLTLSPILLFALYWACGDPSDPTPAPQSAAKTFTITKASLDNKAIDLSWTDPLLTGVSLSTSLTLSFSTKVSSSDLMARIGFTSQGAAVTSANLTAKQENDTAVTITFKNLSKATSYLFSLTTSLLSADQSRSLSKEFKAGFTTVAKDNQASLTLSNVPNSNFTVSQLNNTFEVSVPQTSLNAVPLVLAVSPFARLYEGTSKLIALTNNAVTLTLDLTTPKTYTVIAEDLTTTRTYTIKGVGIVTNSSSKDMTSVKFMKTLNPSLTGDVTTTRSGTIFTATVPSGTDVTTLIPTIVHSGKSVTPSSGTAQNFTNDVIYTVTAQDNSTAQYQISLKQEGAKYYRINFNVNDGSGTVFETRQVLANQKATEPSSKPLRTNYKFEYWTASLATLSPFDFNNALITRDTSLYAKWKQLRIVTYHTDGGTLIKSDTLADGQTKVNKPADPTKDDGKSLFMGWFTNPTFTTPFSFETSNVTSSITLYAKWKQLRIVTYNTGGGTPIKNDTLADGQTKVNKPTDPTLNIGGIPSRFGGWFADQTFATPFDFANTNVTTSVTLYAKWVSTRYIVTYESMGTVVKYDTVDAGAKLTPPKDPTRPLHSFMRWSLQKQSYDGENIIEFDFNTPINSSITLYASWSILSKVIITYNSDGGTPLANDTLQITTRLKQEDLKTPSKNGFAFNGWVDESGVKVPFWYDYGSYYALLKNTIFTATWIQKLVVTVQKNNGEALQYDTVLAGSYPSDPPTPTRAGFKFAGWYKDDNKWTIPYDPKSQQMSASFTIYARWYSPITVSFVSNGGTAIAPINAYQNDKISSPPPPTKAGKSRFDAWYTDQAFTQRFDFNSTIPASMTLFANWIAPRIVTFQYDNGSPATYDTLVDGTKTSPPPIPSKNGNVFDHWYTSAGMIFDFANQTVVSNITLSARWTASLGFLASFSFEKSNNPDMALEDEDRQTIYATIDEVQSTIVINLSAYQYPDRLVASFTKVDADATVKVNGVTQMSGQTVNDFRQNLIYTVTKQTGASKTYSVVLNRNKYAYIPDVTFRGAFQTEKQLLFKGDSLDITSAANIQNFEHQDLLKGFAIYSAELYAKNLKGIEFFTNLRHLEVNYNNLERMNLRKNTKLTYLDAQCNPLNYWDISQCLDLQVLHLGNNQCRAGHNTTIKNIDLSIFHQIRELSLIDMSMTSINLPKPELLETLYIANNLITSLSAILKFPNLKNLGIYDNPITEKIIDLSQWTRLETVYVGGLQQDTSVILPATSTLTTVDVSNSQLLKKLDLSKNSGLTFVSFLDCPALTELDLRTAKDPNIDIRSSLPGNSYHQLDVIRLHQTMLCIMLSNTMTSPI